MSIRDGYTKTTQTNKNLFLIFIFNRWNEAYTWTNVNCCVHNIIVGKLWMEQYGTMEVVNHVNGLRAVLTFKPAGWASKDLHRVEGFIIDKKYGSFACNFVHSLTNISICECFQ